MSRILNLNIKEQNQQFVLLNSCLTKSKPIDTKHPHTHTHKKNKLKKHTQIKNKINNDNNNETNTQTKPQHQQMCIK